MSAPVEATITRTGELGREPYARLADGREMPMGWNMGQTFEVGTKGTAQYEWTAGAGLWRFAPEVAASSSAILDGVSAPRIVAQVGSSTFVIDAGVGDALHAEGVKLGRVYDRARGTLGDPLPMASIAAHSPGISDPTAPEVVLADVADEIAALIASR